MKSIVKLAMMSMFFCAGCDHDVPGNLPSITPVSELPVFAEQKNEVEIADSFKDTDPTMVLGAIVERANGLVHSVDSFLLPWAETEVKPVSKQLFRDFLENSVVAEAEWLTFFKAQVNDSTRAEVTVTEVANASVGISSINREGLDAFAQKIPTNRRDDYGVIVGYRDFVIAASFFKEQAIEGTLSGYGAKIGGKWFGKHEGVSVDHRVVAVWSPLPFVLSKAAARATPAGMAEQKRDVPLTIVTREALENGSVRIRPLDGQPRWFKLRPHP